MVTRIQLRRDSASNWSVNNPVLAIGEFGIDTDTFNFKIGNGVDSWNNLNYFSVEVEDVVSLAQLNDAIAVKADLVNGRVPVEQLPFESVVFRGTFGSAQSTTEGDLPATGELGDLYVADEEITSTNAGNVLFRSGDKALWDGEAWKKNEGVAEIATTEEAEAGIINNKLMTPLRTAEAIAEQTSTILTTGEYITESDLETRVTNLGGDGLVYNAPNEVYDLDYASAQDVEAGSSTTKVLTPSSIQFMILDGGDFPNE